MHGSDVIRDGLANQGARLCVADTCSISVARPDMWHRARALKVIIFKEATRKLFSPMFDDHSSDHPWPNGAEVAHTFSSHVLLAFLSETEPVAWRLSPYASLLSGCFPAPPPALRRCSSFSFRSAEDGSVLRYLTDNVCFARPVGRRKWRQGWPTGLCVQASDPALPPLGQYFVYTYIPWVLTSVDAWYS